MKSAAADVFFSCSFKDDDNDINTYFKSICCALDLRCKNVSTAFAQLPPDKARQMINDMQGVIAVATKRVESTDHKHYMPTAVNDELSIAYGLKTPILMFVENGVVVDGFKSSYCTYLEFDRSTIFSADYIEKAVSAIHNFKLDLISTDHLLADQDSSEIINEHYHSLVELKEVCGEYMWEYSIDKKMYFTKQFKKAFKIGAWSDLKSIIPEEAAPIEYEIIITKSSRDFAFISEIEENSASCFEASIKIEPYPEENDFIEYYVTYRSKYLNPIFIKDCKDLIPVKVNGTDFICTDGIIPITRTKKASFEFRFPREYGISLDNIAPIVASYCNRVDYLVESEISRANIVMDSVAGKITMRFEIDSPLLRHIYGIAWNPPR